MKRYIFFAFFLLMVSVSSIAQTRCDCFERLYNLGYYYDNIENTAKAIEAYKDALNFMEPSQESYEIYQWLAMDYNTLKKYDSAALYAVKSIEFGLSPGKYMSEMPEVYARIPAASKREWPDGVNVDWRLYDKVRGNERVDQLMRNDRETFFGKQWLHDSLVRYKKPIEHSLSILIDSATYSHVISMLDTYKGMPSYKKVGFLHALSAFEIIHTVRYPVMGKDILARLRELNSRCEPISKKQILTFEDVRKYSMDYNPATNKNGKVYAGLYGYDRYNNIDDLKKVDSIRFAHNLYRLKEDVIAPDTLPAGYVPAPYPKNFFCMEKYQIR